jgi:hypothetical protein
MSSGELEAILTRNTEFCTVLRSGPGGGVAGLYSSINGEYIRGIGGGRLPEYSYMREELPRLVRGWRNVCYELLVMKKLRPTPEIIKLLGRRPVYEAIDRGTQAAPMATPEPNRIWIDDHGARGYSGEDREDPYRGTR